MKKYLVIAALGAALTMGGCAGDLQKIQSAWGTLTQTTVPAQYAIVTANSFDALEAGATAYLQYCAKNLSTTVCSASNRRAVIKAVRDGRNFRNQVETYITTSTSVPEALYQSLLSVVNDLQVSPAATFGVNQ